MASVSFTLLTAQFISPPKDDHHPSLLAQSLLNLKTPITLKPYKLNCKCNYSAQNQPPKQRQKQKKKKQQQRNPESDVDPVGFLSKYGINDRAFAQFLRERHKGYKERKFEIFSRFIDLEMAAAVYDMMGMHRHRQHRLDYMEWAPGISCNN